MADEVVNVTTSTTLGGLSFSGTEAISVEGQTSVKPTLPAAKEGDLTTRTDDNTGVITLDGGHGLSSGTYDIYWEGGCRYGMDATIATNAMSIDGGAGDVLPAAATPVWVSEQVSMTFPFVGSLVLIGMIQANFPGHIDMQTSAPASVYAAAVSSTPTRFTAADVSGTVATVKFSNGSTLYSNEIKIAVGRDATP